MMGYLINMLNLLFPPNFRKLGKCDFITLLNTLLYKCVCFSRVGLMHIVKSMVEIIVNVFVHSHVLNLLLCLLYLGGIPVTLLWGRNCARSHNRSTTII